jgi:hypothetical protein
MVERRCRYCERIFQPSKYQPGQSVCSEPDCQRRRRADYHRQKIAADPEYRLLCRDSPQKWRSHNPDYWRRYREQHPAAVQRNRQQQQVRDQKRHLCDLANNNSAFGAQRGHRPAFDLKHSAAEIWLLGGGLQDLANNNAAPAQVWILEALPPRKPPQSESCKQQRPGAQAASAR